MCFFFGEKDLSDCQKQTHQCAYGLGYPEPDHRNCELYISTRILLKTNPSLTGQPLYHCVAWISSLKITSKKRVYETADLRKFPLKNERRPSYIVTDPLKQENRSFSPHYFSRHCAGAQSRTTSSNKAPTLRMSKPVVMATSPADDPPPRRGPPVARAG